MWKISRIVLSFASTVLFTACSGASKPPEAMPGKVLQNVDMAAETEPVDQHLELQVTSVFSSSLSPISSPISVQNLHHKEAMANVIHRNLADIQGCFHGLDNDGLDTKGVTLYLEINTKGEVVGGSTTPPGGQQGWSAVAACILPHANQWTFIPRKTPGQTVLVVPLRFDSPL